MKRKEDPRSHYGPLFLLGKGEGQGVRFFIGVVFWSQLFDNECGRLLFFLAVVLSAVLNRWYAERAKSYYVRYGTLQRTRFSMKTHALFLCKCCVRFFMEKMPSFGRLKRVESSPPPLPFQEGRGVGGGLRSISF